MRERDPRLGYTFGAGRESASARHRKRRRRRLLAMIVVTAAGGAAVLGYLRWGPEIESLPALAPVLNATPTTTRVYRWQDANGDWQVSDRHPGDGVVFETLEYRSDVNVLPRPPELQDQD